MSRSQKIAVYTAWIRTNAVAKGVSIGTKYFMTDEYRALLRDLLTFTLKQPRSNSYPVEQCLIFFSYILDMKKIDFSHVVLEAVCANVFNMKVSDALEWCVSYNQRVGACGSHKLLFALGVALARKRFVQESVECLMRLDNPMERLACLSQVTQRKTFLEIVSKYFNQQSNQHMHPNEYVACLVFAKPGKAPTKTCRCEGGGGGGGGGKAAKRSKPE